MKIAANYVCGFVLFWVLGLVASIAGNLISPRDGTAAGIAVILLEVLLWGLAAVWAVRKKVRGIVPGMSVGLAIYVATMVWTLR